MHAHICLECSYASAEQAIFFWLAPQFCQSAGFYDFLREKEMSTLFLLHSLYLGLVYKKVETKEHAR